MLKGFVGLGLAAVGAAFDFRKGYELYFLKKHKSNYFCSNLCFSSRALAILYYYKCY